MTVIKACDMEKAEAVLKIIHVWKKKESVLFTTDKSLFARFKMM